MPQTERASSITHSLTQAQRTEIDRRIIQLQLAKERQVHSNAGDVQRSQRREATQEEVAAFDWQARLNNYRTIILEIARLMNYEVSDEEVIALSLHPEMNFNTIVSLTVGYLNS